MVAWSLLGNLTAWAKPCALRNVKVPPSTIRSATAGGPLGLAAPRTSVESCKSPLFVNAQTSSHMTLSS